VDGKESVKRIVLFLLFWFGNSIVFLLANNFFPDYFVLGNTYMTPPMAAIVSGFFLAFIIILLDPVFSLLHIHVKHNATWALIFWVVNAEVIWVMGRFAEFTGIGLMIFWVALAVGFGVKLLQWLSWSMVQKL